MQDGRHTIITNSVFIRVDKKRVESREVEINIKYKINITVEKRVEIAGTSGKDRAHVGKWARRALVLARGVRRAL